ncbi:hypothetical protein NUU61_009994 [Penicillium alfredii]|uniref:A1 cistron-splicing factor n=1 Tax=Penicillium alfredii TaxID=1506179 RepID=A0A9W9EHD8_9EURO|nr:uncharacterized protein NUU61_009994 [Penicillium alfredii]KAJ5081730.1 hypothetical protein NUU61_009994 [Penicillium alfredii]
MPPLLQPSSTILLPQLPPKTLVGIDLITFTSTTNFHGIRDLPHGWHFLYTGTTESLSLRCGAWFYVGDLRTAGNGRDDSTALVAAHSQNTTPEIYIWRWSSESEALDTLKHGSDADRQEAMRYKANLGATWQSGGLFRYRSRVSPSLLTAQPGSGQTVQKQDEDEDGETEESGRRDWQGLTDRISPSLLSRIVGSPELDVDGRPRWAVTTASTASRDADNIPGLDPSTEGPDGVSETGGEQERAFGFLPIDLKRTWREGAVGRERTEAAQDRSWALGDLINRCSAEAMEDGQTGETQLLGELQFTFLMVLTMMNYSCLQQWKRLLELILTSKQAITDREGFMSDVLRLLSLQLQRCDDVEGGIFEIDGDEGGDFFRKLLMKLRASIDEILGNDVQSAVKSELEKLDAWVKEEYDWELHREAIVRRGMVQLEDGEEVELEMDGHDEDEETGEYAPLVVDLGGSGMPDDGNLQDTEMGG